MKSKMYSRPIITSGRGALVTLLPNLQSPIFFKIQISLHTSLAFNSIVISVISLVSEKFFHLKKVKLIYYSKCISSQPLGQGMKRIFSEQYKEGEGESNIPNFVAS